MYERIEQLIKTKGLTIADAARGAGINQSIFSNMKARGGDLSLDNALKLAKFLGVKVEDLKNAEEVKA